MYILDKIVAYKKQEVEENKKSCPVKNLEQELFFTREPFSLSTALEQSSNCGIIAEFKRRSPSKPEINLGAVPREVIPQYAFNGATAISVLTDEHFFGGSSEFIKIGRHHADIPILRKDFTISEYQIIEAKAIGADAILLIAEILTKEEIRQFTNTAKNLGLNVLLELHQENELSKIDLNVDVIGINNRDLRTFTVDFNHSKNMYEKLPHEITKISESGISHPFVVHELMNVGYKGFLIGEHFMATSNPGKACVDFIKQIKGQE